MSVFGDQAWRKIQRFLIQRQEDVRRSKLIKKERSLNRKWSPPGCTSSMGSVNMQTYRSVKAIQSKIYQIKQDSEKELEEFESLREAILKKKTPKKIKKIAETLEKTTLDDENGNEAPITSIIQKPA